MKRPPPPPKATGPKLPPGSPLAMKPLAVAQAAAVPPQGQQTLAWSHAEHEPSTAAKPPPPPEPTVWPKMGKHDVKVYWPGPVKRMPAPDFEVFRARFLHDFHASSKALILYVTALTDEFANPSGAYQAQLIKLRANVQRLEEELATAHKKTKQQLKKTADVTSRLSEMQAQAQHTLDTAVASERALAEAQARTRSLAYDKEQLATKVSALEWQNQQLKSRLEDARAEADALRAATRPLSAEEVESPALDAAPAEVPIPETLASLPEWAAEHLAGLVVVPPRVLASAARSGYSRPDLVYKALLLLARQYRDRKLGQGPTEAQWATLLAELQLEDEFTLSNAAPAKSREAHTFVVDGQSWFMDRHLKRGNSRDTRNCLRVYYTWDAERKVVVVGAMPEHLDFIPG